MTIKFPGWKYPNVQAIYYPDVFGRVTSQQWLEYAKSSLASNTSWTNFVKNCSGSVAAFKAACFFLLQIVVELEPDAAAVDYLKTFPFLNKGSILGSLKSETSYLAKVADRY